MASNGGVVRLERALATLGYHAEEDIDLLASGIRPGTCGWAMAVLKRRGIVEEPMTDAEALDAAREWDASL